MIFARLPHKIQMPTPFLRIDPEILHTCLMCPCRALHDFFFFSLEMWDPLRHKYPKKYKNQNIWRKKKGFVNDSAGHYVCKTSGSMSRKRRGHWTLKGFGAISLEEFGNEGHGRRLELVKLLTALSYCVGGSSIGHAYMYLFRLGASVAFLIPTVLA